jgi:hypothetical protein
MDVRSQYSADLMTRLKGSSEIQCAEIPPRANFREEREIYVFPLTLLIMDDPFILLKPESRNRSYHVMREKDKLDGR